ncbi:hypothetical protein [Actinocorallia aurantiaca]|uniref:Uncharacterized protein n=1 Tax=Actinocorallia aurantiaca TaxID=46204 RepID=A0ABN3UHT5_9ACTN
MKLRTLTAAAALAAAFAVPALSAPAQAAPVQAPSRAAAGQSCVTMPWPPFIEIKTMGATSSVWWPALVTKTLCF